MPLYEYKCSACGYVFEVLSGFSANGKQKCVRCGGLSHRLISAPQVIFRGSGFHTTDYPKGSNKGSSSCSLTNPCSCSESSRSEDGAD